MDTIPPKYNCISGIVRKIMELPVYEKVCAMLYAPFILFVASSRSFAKGCVPRAQMLLEIRSGGNFHTCVISTLFIYSLLAAQQNFMTLLLMTFAYSRLLLLVVNIDRIS
jgi:hypothetical protein